MPITRIVSAGNPGAERGGVDAASYCDLDHGGWIRRGRRNGRDVRIPLRYDVPHVRNVPDNRPCSEANVVDSDATVVFAYGMPSDRGGKAAALAMKHDRPCLTIDLNRPRTETVDEIVAWLEEDCPSECVLHVTGATEMEAPGIGPTVMAWMIDVISGANGKLFYPIDDHRTPMILREV